MPRAEKNKGKAARKAGGRPFAKGVSGNPAGRPKGALNRSSRVAALLFENESQEIARKAVALAKAGDMQAIRLILERLIPVARERSIEVEMPTVTTATDLPAAVSRLLALVAAGEITPSEGTKLAELLGAWRSALELTEFEARLAALEGLR